MFGFQRPAAHRLIMSMDISGCGMIGISQRSTQARAALDFRAAADLSRVGRNQSVAQPLMVALVVVVRHEVLNCCPKGALAKQDQSFQAGFLDAAHEALRVGVQIGTSGRQFH